MLIQMLIAPPMVCLVQDGSLSGCCDMYSPCNHRLGWMGVLTNLSHVGHEGVTMQNHELKLAPISSNLI